MLRKILAIVVIVSSVAWSQNYTPLTRADKKAFVSAAKAIQMAVEDGSYEGVVRFGNGILKRYESILLDPKSKKLRELYGSVEMIVSEVARLYTADSIARELGMVEKEIRGLADSAECFEAMKKYDDYLDALAERGVGESTMDKHRQMYRECLVKYFDGSFASLQNILTLRHADKRIVDSLRSEVEDAFREMFVSVSSSNDIQELFDFQKMYPGLYEHEISDLIQNHRAKWRLGLKRKPNIENIEQYYRVFPDKDKMIDSVYQKLLYDDYVKNRDMISATKYLAHFPQGKYMREVRYYEEQQQRLAQLQMMYGSHDDE